MIVLYKALAPYFNYYSQSKKYIDYNIIKRIAVDFGIFPDLLSIKKMKLYFKQCINRELSDNINKDVFDINSLVHFMSLCSFEIPFQNKEVDSIARIIFLLQKVSDADGIKEVIVKMGPAALLIKKENIDILHSFKSSFPEYFSKVDFKGIKETSINQYSNFADLMDLN